MKATITTTNEVITGKTLQDIRAALNSRLKVDGPQALTAITEKGTEIHVELHEGQDYIRHNNPGAALGASRSDIKTTAARENGKKGGRPRKTE